MKSTLYGRSIRDMQTLPRVVFKQSRDEATVKRLSASERYHIVRHH